MNKNISIYIARDEGIILKDDDYPQKGKLHLFYDTPILDYDYELRIFKWTCARMIGEIPSYMYPSIKEKECIKLIELKRLPLEIKREDIEKAAKTYIDNFLKGHIDNTIINYEENNYEAGRNNALCEFGKDIFKAGADWRINSAWHPVTERPTREGKIIAVEFSKGERKCRHLFVPKDWSFVSINYTITCWAYIDDLLPNIIN